MIEKNYITPSYKTTIELNINFNNLILGELFPGSGCGYKV